MKDKIKYIYICIDFLTISNISKKFWKNDSHLIKINESWSDETIIERLAKIHNDR